MTYGFLTALREKEKKKKKRRQFIFTLGFFNIRNVKGFGIM